MIVADFPSFNPTAQSPHPVLCHDISQEAARSLYDAALSARTVIEDTMGRYPGHRAHRAALEALAVAINEAEEEGML